MVWFIPVISAVLTGGALLADYLISEQISSDTAQMEVIYNFFLGQTTLSEFVSQCWPSLLFFAGVMMLGYAISKPRRPGRRVA